ncbi:unnamed protein product [Schistocephalus solidus]|uniref:Uncharacterized protein n=1 Tax=Schistocephalus solidus TaxID=70667 RepID=A0A183SRN0_SCHSO|nr:unnamed protein product [Schistocephalus solidus]
MLNLLEVDYWRARVNTVPFGASIGLGKSACLLASPRQSAVVAVRRIREAVFDVGQGTSGDHCSFREHRLSVSRARSSANHHCFLKGKIVVQLLYVTIDKRQLILAVGYDGLPPSRVERRHRQLKTALPASEDWTPLLDKLPLRLRDIRVALKLDMASSAVDIVFDYQERWSRQPFGAPTNVLTPLGGNSCVPCSLFRLPCTLLIS